MYVWHHRDYLGMAHGIGGILYTLLHFPEVFFLSVSFPSQEVTTFSLPSGSILLYPTQLLYLLVFLCSTLTIPPTARDRLTSSWYTTL
mgnify:CR=1 FL=1